MTLVTRIPPVKYQPQDTTAVINFANDQARNVKDSAYGALGNDTGNDAPAITAAANDTPATRGGIVYLPPGDYRCVTAIVTPTDRQVRIVGAGPEATRIHVPNGTTATPGVIQLRGAEWRQSVENLQITFDQPDTSNRALLTHFVPAIYAQAVSRFRVQHVRIVRCWDGIDMRQNSNAEINDLEISHFNNSIHIDGALDSSRIAHLHDWVFGCSANQIIAVGNPLNIGIKVGRCDGLHLSNSLFLCGQGVHTFPGVMVPGPGNVHMTNCQFDTWSGLRSDDGYVQISDSLFSTRTAGGYQAITMTPGGNGNSVMISNCQILTDGGGLTPVQVLGDTSGGFLHFNITDSVFYTAAANQSSIIVDGSGGGILHANIANNHFNRTGNVTYTAPTIGLGANVRATIANNIATDKGTGGGDFIGVTNSFPVIDGNITPGWGLSYVSPAQPLGGSNLGATITGSNRELITALGFMQASGLEALSSNNPPFAVRRYTGTLNGSGAAIFPHGLGAAFHQTGLTIQGWYKVGAGTANPLTVVAADGTNINVSGGLASAPYRVVVLYSSSPHVW